jgi:hypothetical protein
MPRPRQTSPAAAGVGAALGAVLGGPAGAAVGGLLGGVAGTSPVPLEESLRRALAERGLRFESLRRVTRFEAHVLYRDSGERFRRIVASVPSRLERTPDQLDDALYDAAITDLGSAAAANG